MDWVSVFRFSRSSAFWGPGVELSEVLSSLGFSMVRDDVDISRRAKEREGLIQLSLSTEASISEPWPKSRDARRNVGTIHDNWNLRG